MAQLPIPYYDYGPGIRETNESRVNRWVAYTMPSQVLVSTDDTRESHVDRIVNYTFDEYKFNFDTGVVTKVKTGEEIDLSVDVTYE